MSPHDHVHPRPGQGEGPGAERVLVVAFVVNGLLALGKLAGGLVSGSPSLTADGYHSLADLATGGVSWLAYRLSKLPPDEDHHYGHGKFEAFAALTVGLVLVATGVLVLVDAVEGERPDYHGAEAPLALGVALVSLFSNEWLTRMTARAAREHRSPTLEALSRDNRSDMLTSVLVVLGVGTTWLGAGSIGWIAWVEPVVTGIIGLFVLSMGTSSVKGAFDTLMDRAPDAGLRERVSERAAAVPGVRGVQSVAVHPLGASVRVDMEISVDGDLSVRKGHEIAHEVEDAVTRAEGGVVQVAVHVNPAASLPEALPGVPGGGPASAPASEGPGPIPGR